MKLIGISGAQGAGKSTLLKELAARGWAVDDFKVSRAVQTALGWDTLERVMDSPETMMQFQTEVFKQKLTRDSHLSALVIAPLKTHSGRAYSHSSQDTKTSIMLTERTFADILAYTSHWCWKFVDEHRLNIKTAIDFLVEYTIDCQNAQLKIYSGAILLPFMDHVIWEADPNRAKRSDVDLIFENIEKFMERRTPITHRRMTISSKSVPDRVTEVERFLESL